MRRLLTVLLLACAALTTVAAPAQAHNVLVGSDPEKNAKLSRWPSKVTLEFDQPARRGFSQVTVTGPGGVRFDQGKPSTSGVKVTAELKAPGPAGSYVIGYRILSSDGHPVTGKITFTLDASEGGDAVTVPVDEPAATATLQSRQADGGELSAQATEAAQNGGAGMAVVWIAGALVLLGGATVVAMRRSAPRDSTQLSDKPSDKPSDK
ncbi:copper resistance CopC family protein [Streptosporangium soli]|nr:copper resistance protein CopC [Streptosporangium sp. KLBMP 9127]